MVRFMKMRPSRASFAVSTISRFADRGEQTLGRSRVHHRIVAARFQIFWKRHFRFAVCLEASGVGCEQVIDRIHRPLRQLEGVHLALMQDGCERSVSSGCRVNVFSRGRAVCTLVWRKLFGHGGLLSELAGRCIDQGTKHGDFVAAHHDVPLARLRVRHPPALSAGSRRSRHPSRAPLLHASRGTDLSMISEC